MKKTLQVPRLGKEHNVEAFKCGESQLDTWLRTTARQHITKGISQVYVAIDPANPDRILGFYSLNAGEVTSSEWPATVKRLPRTVSMVLIGRLARDLSMRGQGLGEVLVVDALKRIVKSAEQIGIALIAVDAKDDKAAGFYSNLGFQSLPDQPRRLVMTVSAARASLT